MAERFESARGIHPESRGSAGRPELSTRLSNAAVALAFWVGVVLPLAYPVLAATGTGAPQRLGLLFGVHAVSLVIGHQHGR